METRHISTHSESRILTNRNRMQERKSSSYQDAFSLSLSQSNNREEEAEEEAVLHREIWVAQRQTLKLFKRKWIKKDTFTTDGGELRATNYAFSSPILVSFPSGIDRDAEHCCILLLASGCSRFRWVQDASRGRRKEKKRGEESAVQCKQVLRLTRKL